MRVIAGRAKGIRLLGSTNPALRPLMDRIKESLFELLSARLPGSRVLDLYAGTGSIGIEALSRGAARAWFVDWAPESIELVRRNLDHTGFREQAEVVGESCDNFLMTTDRQFDIIFIDPPFGDFKKVIGGLLDTIHQRTVLTPGGVAVVRYFFKDTFRADNYETVLEKRYGENAVCLLGFSKEET